MDTSHEQVNLAIESLKQPCSPSKDTSHNQSRNASGEADGGGAGGKDTTVEAGMTLTARASAGEERGEGADVRPCVRALRE